MEGVINKTNITFKSCVLYFNMTLMMEISDNFMYILTVPAIALQFTQKIKTNDILQPENKDHFTSSHYCIVKYRVLITERH